MIKAGFIEISSLITTWLLIKSWYDRLAKIVTPAVKEAEKRALDGLIDKNDRKQVALTLIGSLEASGALRLNFLSKLILSKVIDIIAQKMPNFTISQKIRKDEFTKQVS